MWRIPSPSVAAMLIAVTVIFLTLFGTLDDIAPPVRGMFQAIGTVAGIYLGATWQGKDQRQAAAGSGRSAMANILALARSVQALLETSISFRERISQSPPRTIDAYQNAINSVLSGMEGHAQAILLQSQAAAQAWLPFVPEGDEYLERLAGFSSSNSSDGGTT